MLLILRIGMVIKSIGVRNKVNDGETVPISNRTVDYHV